jgi:hypothetical protein
VILEGQEARAGPEGAPAHTRLTRRGLGRTARVYATNPLLSPPLNMPTARPPVGSMFTPVGSTVLLHSLVSRPALNGRRGTVVTAMNKRSGRVGVLVEGEDVPIALKPANLTDRRHHRRHHQHRHTLTRPRRRGKPSLPPPICSGSSSPASILGSARASCRPFARCGVPPCGHKPTCFARSSCSHPTS